MVKLFQKSSPLNRGFSENSDSDKIKPVRPGIQHNGNEIRTTDVFSFNQLISPRRVFYTPDTPLTETLMDTVGQKLHLKRLNPKTIETSSKGYYAFRNFSEISDWLERLNSNDAIVLFDDLENSEEFPKQLSYTIRIKGVSYSSEIFAQDGAAKPHREFGNYYLQFMRLQWAIDTSFIDVLTGTNITQRLSVQEFPSIGRVNTDEQIATFFGEFLPVLCWMSLFLVFVFLMSRLLEERSTGIQELVKMAGVSSNTFGISHFLNALPAGLVYCVVGTILFKVTSNPLIDHSNGLIIFIMMALHFVSVVAMAFPCSYITESTQYTVSLSVFMYIALWMPARLLSSYNVQGITLLSGLLPHVPMQWLWLEIVAREQYGEGLSFSDVLWSHSARSGPAALGALCLALQALVLFSLAWYLARVRPGKHGQALPWNFIMQKQYWTKNEVIPDSEQDEDVPITREPKFFEEPPKNMEVGIKVENITKIYPKQTALSNVSFDVYKGEITVLLGHNGAGKTTLMSIITGMTSATEGRILVNGMDTTRCSDEVRMQLGLCPQHNLFFADLTVLEHAMFFSLLKGGSFTSARKSSMELLEKLGLHEKAHVYSSALSGGMKRRLQLACALAGGAEVLVLDEPTSGLDVETRRELWDLLLSLRGERTVLLTTHFMEEADALGDRVAALHLGRLRCLATTMYLKKAIGTGYRLSFTTNGPPREPSVTSLVTSYVPDATLKEKTINSLSYNLPATASGEFPKLFTALEKKKSKLSIESIGVGVSTLEEVFLKLCSDTDHTFSDDEVDETRIEPTFHKITGLALYWRQFWVLLKRQVKYAWYKKMSFFILQMLIPITMICVFTATNNNNRMRQSNNKIALDMDLYSALPERRVLYDVADDAGLRALFDAWPKVDFRKEHNITGAVLRAAEEDPTDYSKFIAGIEINDTHVKALYTTTVRHAAPVALSLVSNALAARLAAGAGRTLRAHVDPIPPQGPVRYQAELVDAKETDLVITYSLLMVFVILSTNINAVSLPCKERASGARHLHALAGCPAALHWAATAAAHAAACGLLLLAPLAAAAAALDTDSTIDNAPVIMSLVLVLMLGSLAFFALMYFVSCFFQERVAGIVLIAILVIFGLITSMVKTTAEVFVTMSQESNSMSFLDFFLSLASYTMPPHATTVAFAKVVYSARINALCELNRDKCPALFVSDFGFDSTKCCAGENPLCYMCIDKLAPGMEMIILTVQFFFYMGLVILTQRGVFNSLHDRIFNIRYRNSAHKVEGLDEIVRAEAIYVNKQIKLPKKTLQQSDQAMLVSDLHKNYHRICGKSCNAVKGISFSVKKGECFGLLGVNGAGKSSTFKMLTGEECATQGEIYANGYYSHEKQYLRSLGYCPQFFGLDEFQTGRENLELLLTLRGLDAEDVSREVKSWIQVVGLEKYTERVVAGYSGGCTRRLAAAAALSAGAPLTLLDEPTAGVDVAARRRVWRALRRGLRQGRAVVITSHSMDEMEALCSRIAIMSAGAVRALGAAGELRARHAAGYAVLIKVARAQGAGDEVDSTTTELERLKGTLQTKFDCTLRDEHKTMLHYHINETMRYSNLFTALEELKAAYPLIEDYSVTETTLEEVFLSFAKEQRQNPEPDRRNHVV